MGIRRPVRIEMKNDRGVELALNTVVIMAILLIAAVVIIAFFTGAIGKVFGPISNLLGGGVEQIDKTTPPVFKKEALAWIGIN